MFGLVLDFRRGRFEDSQFAGLIDITDAAFTESCQDIKPMVEWYFNDDAQDDLLRHWLAGLAEDVKSQSTNAALMSSVLSYGFQRGNVGNGSHQRFPRLDISRVLFSEKLKVVAKQKVVEEI